MSSAGRSSDVGELIDAIREVLKNRKIEMRDIELNEETIMRELSFIYSLVRHRIDILRELEEAQSGVPLSETRKELDMAVKILSIASQLILKRAQSGRALQEYESVLREVLGNDDSARQED